MLARLYLVTVSVSLVLRFIANEGPTIIVLCLLTQLYKNRCLRLLLRTTLPVHNPKYVFIRPQRAVGAMSTFRYWPH